jgi:hypothetical protein
MKTTLRNILAFVVGFIAGSVVNMALIVVGTRLVAPPPGVNPNDMQSLQAGMHLMGPKHFIFPFLAHALGTFAGALVAYRIAASHRAALAYGIGGLTLVGGIVAACMLPAPTWFIAVDLVLAYLPMAFLATKVGARLMAK